MSNTYNTGVAIAFKLFHCNSTDFAETDRAYKIDDG